MQKKPILCRSLVLIRVNSWLIWKNKPNFEMVKKSLSIYMKVDYEDFHALGRRKNKANSKPNKANMPAFGRKC